MDCGVQGEGVWISPENFPDNVFRNYISSSFDRDHDAYLSDEEIAAVTVIDFMPASAAEKAGRGKAQGVSIPGPVKSLKGLEYFTELQTLSCAGNQLTTMDVSRNIKLQELSCGDNLLTSLDLSKNSALRILSCAGNLLTELDISQCPDLTALIHTSLPELSKYKIVFSADGCALVYDVGINLIPSFHLGDGLTIDEAAFPDPAFRSYVAASCDMDRDGTLAELTLHGHTALQILDCCENQGLAVLDLSGCSGLLKLECSGTGLLCLDLGYCRLLEELSCGESQSLRPLDIGSCTSLTTLSCGGIQVQSLDLSCFESLQKLSCGNNPALTALNADGCTALTELVCSDCPLLESLNINNCTELNTLECRNDRLSSLNLSSCERLSNLKCDGNLLKVVNVTPCFILSAIMEYYSPVVENGIISYPYEGHKIFFDEGVILINMEPDFVLPDSLKTISEEAFAGGAFRYALLSGQTVSIGRRAFADCTGLDFVCIPNQDVLIDEQAFGERDALVILGIPGGTAEAFAQAHGFIFAPQA